MQMPSLMVVLNLFSVWLGNHAITSDALESVTNGPSNEPS
ncbi:hypothetical protein EC9_04160 [Rosistilla ulvae]|uniref:Uncharacterized protein n=1 Tax=Rosistilla ulvae TaxID=1930277 RepID=A0A517LUG3_9BACT|nr:hypothetical protein EC9_04160 [Rosistilla ulvae]